MKTKMKKRVSLLLVVVLVLMTVTDGTAIQAAKKKESKKVNVKVSSVRITNTGKKLRLQRGKRFRLKTLVKVKPNKNKYKKLKFKSSNRKVVLVNSRGLLKGMKVGTAKITATSKTNPKKKAAVSVSVTKDILVSSIKLNKTRIIADEFNEEEVQLKVKKILPANAKNKEVEWSTSDEDVADVDDDGVVITGDVGTALITATAADKGGSSATCKVIVTKNTDLPEEDDEENTDSTITPTPPVPSEVITPTPAAGNTDSVSPSPVATDNIVTPTPKTDDKGTPSPGVPSKTPSDEENVFGVSDPYKITISEENEAYATSVAKRLVNGMSEEDATIRNKNPQFNADGSVTFTSTDSYHSGMCFYIDPDVKTSTTDEGTTTYEAKKVDLTKYKKVRFTVKDAYVETSLKVLSDGNKWWSKGEKWEGSDNITESERTVEYDLDAGSGLAWDTLKEVEAIGLGWHNEIGMTATIVSIELVGKCDAVTPTESPKPVVTTPPPIEELPSVESVPAEQPPTKNPIEEEPSVETGSVEEYPGKNPEDVAALQKIIAEQRALGATVSEDLDNTEEYEWNDDGRLRAIDWGESPHGKKLSGSISFSPFTELQFLNLTNSQLVDLDVSSNVALKRLICSLNNLRSLDVSGNVALTHLNCSYNYSSLRSLDVSKNLALESLDCECNKLNSLDVSSNPALTVLSCYNNQLSDLDVSSSPALTGLYCDNNQLSDLDVSKNSALESLVCDSNQLSSLDVSKNPLLKWLSCSKNQLTTLDLTNNTELTHLSCDDTVMVIGYDK